MMELKRVWWVQRARVTSVRSTKVRLTMFVLGRRKQRKKTKDEVLVKLKEDKRFAVSHDSHDAGDWRVDVGHRGE